MIKVVIILAVIAVGMFFLLYFSIKKGAETKKELKETKEKLEEVKQQAVENAKIDQQTVEQVESISSGDIDADFNAGVDLLHNLSARRTK